MIVSFHKALAGDKLQQYGVSPGHFGVSAAMVDEGCGQAGFSMTATVHHPDKSYVWISKSSSSQHIFGCNCSFSISVGFQESHIIVKAGLVFLPS